MFLWIVSFLKTVLKKLGKDYKSVDVVFSPIDDFIDQATGWWPLAPLPTVQTAYCSPLCRLILNKSRAKDVKEWCARNWLRWGSKTLCEAFVWKPKRWETLQIQSLCAWSYYVKYHSNSRYIFLRCTIIRAFQLYHKNVHWKHFRLLQYCFGKKSPIKTSLSSGCRNAVKKERTEGFSL